jgi:general secretion pathway protein G
VQCPQCKSALTEADARCASCGFEISGSAARSGVPTWVWVLIGAGALLVLLVCGGLVAGMFFGLRSAESIGASAAVLPGAHSITSAEPGISELADALKAYASAHGERLPARLEDLLEEPDAHGQPYLSGALPLDRFGQPYTYRPVQASNGWSLVLLSLGRDGRDGGSGDDADIVVLAITSSH